jgi:hypothetical protein
MSIRTTTQVKTKSRPESRFGPVWNRTPRCDNKEQTASGSVPLSVYDVLRSPGQQLDSAMRGSMESRFRHDFSQVRVHTDDQAAKSVKVFQTRAYTVGNDIVFGAGQYAPATSQGRELLFHELIHVTQNGGNTRGISFWNKEEHHVLTQQVVDFYRKNPYSPSIMSDPLFGSEQFYQIVDASFNMDVKGKRILWTGPRFLIKNVPIISPLGTKGEGPEHGEDDNYSRQGKKPGEVSDKARDRNVKLQEEYVKKSLKFYRQEVTPEVKQIDKNQISVTPPIRRFSEGKVQVTSNVKEMFKALGDACHVAQDRGAHWEGTKDMGHDDPRARKGTWDPDSPTDNAVGEENARKNTYDVFKMWAWGVTMEIGREG